MSPIGRKVVVLCLFLFAQPDLAKAEGLMAYGKQFCAEAGIPPDECTLVPPGDDTGLSTPSPAEPHLATADPINGSKKETLVEHGRRLCAKEGVPLEDCKALPTKFRSFSDAPEAGSELSTFEGVSPVTYPKHTNQHPVRHARPPAYLAAPPITSDRRAVRYAPPPDKFSSPPLVTDQPAVRYARPRSYSYAPPPAVDHRDHRSVRHAYPRGDIYAPPLVADHRAVRHARPRGDYLYAPPIAVDRKAVRRDHLRGGYLYAPPPVTDHRAVRHARPRGDYLYAPPIVVDRKAVGRDHLRGDYLYAPPLATDHRADRRADRRAYDDTPSGKRCLRSVRYSRPPSYRYVACD